MKYIFKKQIAAVLVVFLLIFAFGLENKANAGTKDSPKNIIIMISDGCGYFHVDAASFYEYGDKGAQVYEGFPVRLAMSTYSAGDGYNPDKAWESFSYFKKDATDSAAAATAMSTGIKTYNGAIGVDTEKKPVKHILERCEELGKATGVVTSVQISHATPAGFVAHNTNRNDYEDIAKEMVLESACEVIMGCGHPLYNENGKPVEIFNDYKYVGGKDIWEGLKAGKVSGDCDGDGIDDSWTFIEDRNDFIELSHGETNKRVIGVAKVHKTLQKERSGDEDMPYSAELIDSVPTLEEMTDAALNVLDDDEDGLFLMVEGGAVDWASHDNQSGRMIEEQIAFNNAVEAVVEWVGKKSSWDETLLIVTADHECGYLTGPDSGWTWEGPVWNEIKNKGQGKVPGMEWNSGGHTNSLVPFYAKGTGAYEFRKDIRKDKVRGAYIDNTNIAEVCFELLK